MTRSLSVLILTASLAGAMMAASSPVKAQWGYRWHDDWGHWHDGWGHWHDGWGWGGRGAALGYALANPYYGYGYAPYYGYGHAYLPYGYYGYSAFYDYYPSYGYGDYYDDCDCD